VPEKSIAITFDDAYISVYNTAMPLRQQHGFSFTVFVNTEPIEKGYSNFMNWEQLRNLQSNGGAVANHSHSHAYLVRRFKGEKDEQWQSRMHAEILTAQSRLSEKLGQVEKIFAYPYGEFTSPLQSIVTELGFYGIGQHSGAVGFGSDFSAVPRFPMATGFDNLDQFAIKVNSRPLPVEVLAPEHRLIATSIDTPIMRFRLGIGDFAADKLSCYFSGNKMAINWLDRQQRLVEIKPLNSVGKGRIKYNCTAPSTSKSGVYYWYSHLLIKR
jgi:peptidoglycan/xylan/chitin deacetylase (PgdA/CDA1 family)